MTLFVWPPISVSTASLETILTDRLAGSLINFQFDYVALTEGSTTDTWVYKLGGSGGTTQGTITVTYTDATKSTISTIAKT